MHEDKAGKTLKRASITLSALGKEKKRKGENRLIKLGKGANGTTDHYLCMKSFLEQAQNKLIKEQDEIDKQCYH